MCVIEGINIKYRNQRKEKQNNSTIETMNGGAMLLLPLVLSEEYKPKTFQGCSLVVWVLCYVVYR